MDSIKDRYGMDLTEAEDTADYELMEVHETGNWMPQI